MRKCLATIVAVLLVSTCVVQINAQNEEFETLKLNGIGNEVLSFSPNAGPILYSVYADETTLEFDSQGTIGVFSIFQDSDSRLTMRQGQSSLDADRINLQGRVGIADSIPDGPDTSLHVYGDSFAIEPAQVKIENSFPLDPTSRTLLQMTNSGPVRFQMTNSETAKTWTFVADSNDQFQIRQNGAGTANMAIRGNGTFAFNNLGESNVVFQPTGNVFVKGTVNEESDRNAKTDIRSVDADEVLNKVAKLPISEWSYKKEENVRHIGPMAQDFYKEFGLGAGDKTIATLDTAGVALAAIQSLNQKIQAQELQIQELKTRLQNHERLAQESSEQLASRVEQLEQLIEKLLSESR